MIVMCHFFLVSRSGYYSFVKRMSRPKKDAALAEMIRQQQDKCFHSYGYRRMWQCLKGSKGIYHNPKTILRVMKKYGLLAEIQRRRRWQQMGQQLHRYRNLLNRDFILKTECIYRHKPATFSEAKEMIDRYIHFYNHERIQSKTGVAPLTLRHSY